MTATKQREETTVKASKELPRWQLDEDIRAAELAASMAAGMLAELEHRVTAYEVAVRSWHAQGVDPSLVMDPNSPGSGGWRDARLFHCPTAEDVSAAEGTVRETARQVDDLRRQQREMGRWDPADGARAAGARFFAGWPLTIGAHRLVPGQPVFDEQLVGLDKNKLETMRKYGYLREI